MILILSNASPLYLLSDLLLKEFFSEMNSEYYKKSLDAMESIIEKCGEKVFQQRIQAIIHKYSLTYIEDDVAQECLSQENSNR